MFVVRSLSLYAYYCVCMFAIPCVCMCIIWHHTEVYLYILLFIWFLTVCGFVFSCHSLYVCVREWGGVWGGQLFNEVYWTLSFILQISKQTVEVEHDAIHAWGGGRCTNHTLHAHSYTHTLIRHFPSSLRCICWICDWDQKLTQKSKPFSCLTLQKYRVNAKERKLMAVALNQTLKSFKCWSAWLTICAVTF